MTTSRTGELQLRGRAGPLRGRLYWPRTGPAPFLVAFSVTDDGSWWQELSTATGLLALAVRCGPCDVPDAIEAAGWAAENAARLGGDAGGLLIAGAGRGGALAAAVARHACADGWPPLRRQVLVCTSPIEPAPPAGMAPATAVTIERDPSGDEGRYAALLRSAGCEVHELRYTAPDPAAAALIRHGPALLADLGAALSIE